MTTRLTDVIEPMVFADYISIRTTELSAIFQSGIVATDAQLDALASGGGTTFNLPYWEDLASTEPNIGDDNPANIATPLGITASEDVAVKHFRNQAWSSMDLLTGVIGEDPMMEIGDKVAGYWARVDQQMLIASLTGVEADNVANDSSDMVVDIATDAVGAPAAAELISAEAIIDAKQTMGDHAEGLAAIGMHSVCFSRLQKLNLIDYIPDSRGEIQFPTYLGYRVIVDDGCPAVDGANRTTYTTYLFGTGAVAYGNGAARTPVEVEREALAGTGSGQETLVNRREFIMHPRGVKFTNSTVAGQSPTNAELQNALNWDRVYDRKLVRIAILKTNG